MTTGEWFGGVFDRALARWVNKDPVAAETKVAGLVDKVMNLDVFWSGIGAWLDANPDKVAPFVANFLTNIAAQQQNQPPAP